MREGVPHQPANGRYAHGVSETHPRLPVAHVNGESVRPLQARVLAPGQRTDSRRPAAAVDQKLHTAATLGSAQAAGDRIAPNLPHGAVLPATAIEGCHAVRVARRQRIHALAMPRRHVSQHPRCLLFRPPAFVVRTDILQHVSQDERSSSGCFGQRQLQERQPRPGLLEAAHTSRARARCCLCGWRPPSCILPATHHEQARAALRSEPARVDDGEVDSVAELRKKGAHLCQVIPAPRRKETRNVLQQHGGWHCATAASRCQQLQKRPHRSRVLARQSCPIAGQRQIDAGERWARCRWRTRTSNLASSCP